MTYDKFCYLMAIKPKVDFQIARTAWNNPDKNWDNIKQECYSKGLNGKQALATWEFYKEIRKILDE